MGARFFHCGRPSISYNMDVKRSWVGHRGLLSKQKSEDKKLDPEVSKLQEQWFLKVSILASSGVVCTEEIS